MSLENYYEEDIQLMTPYIQTYVKENESKINASQGYRLGILTCNFYFFGVLFKARQRGEELTNDDKESLASYEALVSELSDFLPYIIDAFDSAMEIMKEMDKVRYKSYLDSRGEFEKNYSQA